MSDPNATWTYSRPALSGWYWHQPFPGSEIRLMHVRTVDDVVLLSGRWYGPIPVPNEGESWRPDRERS